MDLLFVFFCCIVLHAFSLMSLAFIHCLDATFLLLSRSFYDFHLRIFMHMRASESYIYSLSFPVRGAWSMHGYLYLSLPAPSCMCPSKHTAQNPFFLCILMSFIHSYPPFFLLIFLSFFSPLKTPKENVYQDSSRRCSKLQPHFEPSAKAPKSQQMESLGCSSGSMRLSCGAPASPMHLAFCVKVLLSTLPSSSPPFEATLPSPPAIGTRWQQHCR